MIIKKIEVGDINSIVDIHLMAFASFFLSSLGKSFLWCYYYSLVRNNDGIGYCVIHDNLIVGFIAGTKKSKGFHKKLIVANLLIFSKQLIIVFFTRPKAVLRLLLNLEKHKDSFSNEICSELLSIGVDPRFTGMGVGNKLLQAFENEVKVNNVNKILLTTDYSDNDKVIAFYLNNGYQILYDFIAHPKRRMYKMIKYL